MKIILMKRFAIVGLIVCLALNCLTSIFSAEPVYSTQKNFDYHVRGGIGNTLKKLESGEEVRVAYLGGSITAASGYRIKTSKWLQENWSKVKIHEINASVSGTGSMLGVYRIEHDVLQYRPDLLFVEFAVNDGGTPPTSIWRQMEGIIRQTWLANPKTDIVFIYTFCVPFDKALIKGDLPQSASAMEMLADFHHIPSINFMNRVFRMKQEGKLIYTPSGEDKPGVLVFSKDGTHPGDEGHELYLKDIQQAFEAMKNIAPVDHRGELDRFYVKDAIGDAKMYSITESMLKGDWRKLTPKDRFYHFTNQLDEIWTTEEPGASLSFRFKGTEVLLYDIVGPNAGEIQVTIDGVTQQKPVPRFDTYCIVHYSFRITTMLLAQNLDPNIIHEVQLELRGGKPDRSWFAKQGNFPLNELESEKFQGNHLWFGKILVRGELK